MKELKDGPSLIHARNVAVEFTLAQPEKGPEIENVSVEQKLKRLQFIEGKKNCYPKRNLKN